MTQRFQHGIRISYVNIFFTVLTLLVFCFILVISNQVKSRFNAVNEAMDKFIICQQSSDDIKEAANYLADQARLFVITRKPEFLDAYIKEIEETKRQEKALNSLESVCSKSDLAMQRLRIAIEQAHGLIDMEMYAMRLVCEADGTKWVPARLAQIPLGEIDKNSSREKKLETAVNNLFGDGYLIYKMRINVNCELTVTAIEQQIKRDLNVNAKELGHNINRLRLLFLVMLVVNVLIFIALAYLVMIPLAQFRNSIKKDEKLKVIGSLEFKGLAESYNEIYDIKAQNQKSLLKKAEYDALTGILNRHAFDQICQTSAEKKQRIALLLIDMDNFKHINDTYGHIGGDNALKALAKALMEAFREGDYVARVGGDEFAAILPGFDPSAAQALQKKIAVINEKLALLEEKPVSVSVGAAFSESGFSQDLYDKADKALYAVKENGKSGCKIHAD